MEEKNSQENAIEIVETVEKVDPIETAIDIHGLSSETEDILIRTKKHRETIFNGLSSETEDILNRTKKHRENIERIIVPQYIDDQNVKDNYVVTYSHEDHSIVGWEINIEENGPKLPVMYFELGDKIYSGFVLYRKTLISFNCEYLFSLMQKYV